MCADEFKEGSAKGRGRCVRDKAPFQLLVSCLMLCWLPDGFRSFYTVPDSVLPGTSFFMDKSNGEVTLQASCKLISPKIIKQCYLSFPLLGLPWQSSLRGVPKIYRMVSGSCNGLVYTTVVPSLAVNIWALPVVEGEVSCLVARASLVEHHSFRVQPSLFGLQAFKRP